jgi:arginase
MKRAVAVIGAASSIGIRPYDDGRQRKLDHAPAVLRDAGLVARLHARDHGDVTPPAYRDYLRIGDRPRNEESVAAYSRDLAERVEDAGADGAFVLVLGGDCSIILGSLLGARGRQDLPVALAYLDGHADFAAPEESLTGSAASMCLSMAIGRGETPLARLRRGGPLVEDRDVVLVGRRDHAEPWYGHAALKRSAILDIDCRTFHAQGAQAVANRSLERLAAPAGGFWIHVDADILDPIDLSAVDSPEPDGLSFDQLTDLLRPLVDHPRARGMQLTIYDPELDAGLQGARKLTTMFERVLGP